MYCSFWKTKFDSCRLAVAIHEYRINIMKKIKDLFFNRDRALIMHAMNKVKTTKYINITPRGGRSFAIWTTAGGAKSSNRITLKTITAKTFVL